jgi:hypothetical protein
VKNDAGAYISVLAYPDGAFNVINSRNGFVQHYNLKIELDGSPAGN